MRTLFAAAIVGVLLVAGCAEGRKPPAVTSMVKISQGLEYWFGDLTPCTKFGETSFNCDVQCSATGPFSACVAIDPIVPPVKVAVQPFCIDEHEVTNLQYLYCEETGKCPRRPADDLPTTNIASYAIDEKYENYPALAHSFQHAKAYCESVGKRLPTEFEWELVASGSPQQPDLSDKRLYSFLSAGETDVDKCIGMDLTIPACRRDGTSTTTAVKSSVGDVITLPTGGQVYDMGGNVKEWTSTRYQDKVTCVENSLADCNYGTANQLPPEQCDCAGESCFRICADQPADTAICALRFDSAELIDTPDVTLSPEFGNERVIKGGFYYMGENDICQARTTNRDHRPDEGTKTHPALGIRCAATVGTHPDCQ